MMKVKLNELPATIIYILNTAVLLAICSVISLVATGTIRLRTCKRMSEKLTN